MESTGQTGVQQTGNRVIQVSNLSKTYRDGLLFAKKFTALNNVSPVSYTHLTLPTIYSV